MTTDGGGTNLPPKNLTGTLDSSSMKHGQPVVGGGAQGVMPTPCQGDRGAEGPDICTEKHTSSSMDKAM